MESVPIVPFLIHTNQNDTLISALAYQNRTPQCAEVPVPPELICFHHHGGHQAFNDQNVDNKVATINAETVEEIDG